MPPQYASSSSGSDNESVIAPAPKTPAKSARGGARKASTPVKITSASDSEDDAPDDAGSDAGSDDEGEGEEYIVERILDHRFNGKELLLQVKWKGYEKKADLTWEPESNCQGALEAVEEYFTKIGGRPTYQKKSPAPPRSTKRGRQSIGGTPSAPSSTKSTKRARTSLAVSATKNGGDDWNAGSVKEEKGWNPPPANKWEDEVTNIDTIEKGPDGGLVCYVQWKNGKKSQHSIHDIYKNCPQRMLHFYEQHLVFKETFV